MKNQFTQVSHHNPLQYFNWRFTYCLFQLPKTPAEWKEIAKTFELCWNLPHCIGALDGKHVVLKAPINSGTEFFNYKSTFSIVLFALVDGNYNFMFVDVGSQGRISDGGIFQSTELYRKMNDKTLNLPLPEELPGCCMELPYFFAGDSAFAASENLMKPYPGDFPRGSQQRIFNYRLSQGRRVVENAFGISSSVFRVLRTPLLLEPDKAELIVMTVSLLHNYLRTHSPHLYMPTGSLDSEVNGIVTEGAWRKEGDRTSLLPIQSIPRRSTNYCTKMRDAIANYFMNEGSVAWQHNYA